MAQTVSSKLLILFGLVCGTFFFAESGFAAPVANKSSSFSTKMSANTKSSTDTTDSAIANKIRAQRAALDARDAQDNVARKNAMGVDSNGCDSALRKCITARCNGNYSKCATDTDTTFSDKLNACKKNANCTAHEFTLFSNQIKEDKKQEISLAAYNNVLECGNSYNNCIIAECGTKFNKCLSKTAGDKAIAKCKQIATDCTEADSGLVGRIGTVFGIVRQDAEKQIAADENKLRDLRKQMRTTCEHLGSGVMFDERSLDCVYTISFYAGDDMTTPKASKKAYAGSVFDCSPDWFGIDITTFKENAYRLTRSQTAASSAMLGSGVGTAVGAITSGAMGRALDRQKAEKELKKECAKTEGKIYEKGECRDMTDDELAEAAEEKRVSELERDQKNAKEECNKRPGDWDWDEDTNPDEPKCICETDTSAAPTDTCETKNKAKKACKGQQGAVWDKKTNSCLTDKAEQCKASGGTPNGDGGCDCEAGKTFENGKCKITKEGGCKASGATWDGTKCDCPEGYYQSMATPFKCMKSAKKIGQDAVEKTKAGINKAVCKTKEGLYKFADGTVQAFTGEESNIKLPDCTAEEANRQEKEQQKKEQKQIDADNMAGMKQACSGGTIKKQQDGSYTCKMGNTEKKIVAPLDGSNNYTLGAETEASQEKATQEREKDDIEKRKQACSREQRAHLEGDYCVYDTHLRRKLVKNRNGAYSVSQKLENDEFNREGCAKQDKILKNGACVENKPTTINNSTQSKDKKQENSNKNNDNTSNINNDPKAKLCMQDGLGFYTKDSTCSCTNLSNAQRQTFFAAHNSYPPKSDNIVLRKDGRCVYILGDNCLKSGGEWKSNGKSNTMIKESWKGTCTCGASKPVLVLSGDKKGFCVKKCPTGAECK